MGGRTHGPLPIPSAKGRHASSAGSHLGAAEQLPGLALVRRGRLPTLPAHIHTPAPHAVRAMRTAPTLDRRFSSYNNFNGNSSSVKGVFLGESVEAERVLRESGVLSIPGAEVRRRGRCATGRPADAPQ